MLKRILAGALAAVLFSAPALAEVYAGTTIAARTQTILAEASGTLESIDVDIGVKVAADDVLANLRTEKVFASQDGEIAHILKKEGDKADGVVLEIQPVSRYTIHCTVDGAYDSTDTGLVHSGESLYLRCTEDGTHRGTAIVTQISGDTYLTEATGGEFYVGETVYLYRDDDFSSAQRVGIGTVVTSDTETYEAEGKIVKLHVEDGEYVERGELLFETIADGEVQITAESDGIVSAVNAQPGDQIKSGDVLFEIVSPEDIYVEVQVEENIAAALQRGHQAALSYSFDLDELLVPGEVISISHVSENELYTVRIRPETPPAYLGMTVSVRLG